MRGRVRRAPPRDPPEDPKNPFKIPPESIPGGPQIAGHEAGDAVVALWEAFYIEDKRFGFDTLRVPSRSPTPISTSNDFLPQSDGIWGAWAFLSGRVWGFPGSGPA